MCETFSYQVKNTFPVNRATFCYYLTFVKIILKEETLLSMVASNAKIHYLNSCQTDVAKLVCADFVNLSFSTVLFSITIKLFLHVSGILILLGQFEFFRPEGQVTIG